LKEKDRELKRKELVAAEKEREKSDLFSLLEKSRLELKSAKEERYVHVYICIYVYMYVNIYKFTYLYIYVYMYVYIYTFMCMYFYIFLYT
jgi:hypothetical protein